MTELFWALAIIAEPKSVSIYAFCPWPFSYEYQPESGICFLFLSRFFYNFDSDKWNTLQTHIWRHGCRETHNCCISNVVYISTKSGLPCWTTKTAALNDVWGVIKSRNSLWAIHTFVPQCLTPCFTHTISYPSQYWGSCRLYVSQQWRHFHGCAVFIILMKAMLPHAALPPSFPSSVVNIVEVKTKIDIECFLCSDRIKSCANCIEKARCWGVPVWFCLLG